MIARFDAARERLDLACRTLEDLGFVTLSSSFTQYEGLVEILAGDLARAEERLRFGLERLEAMGERAFVSSLAALLAEVLYRQGRHDEAKRFVDRSQETAAPDDLEAQIAWRTVRAKILAATGRLEDAEAHARDAVSLAGETDWSTHHAAACVALGEVLMRARTATRGGDGDPQSARSCTRKRGTSSRQRRRMPCCRDSCLHEPLPSQEAHMLPQFDDQLNMYNYGRTIAAGGPCNWREGDEWAEIRDVER